MRPTLLVPLLIQFYAAGEPPKPVFSLPTKHGGSISLTGVGMRYSSAGPKAPVFTSLVATLRNDTGRRIVSASVDFAVCGDLNCEQMAEPARIGFSEIGPYSSGSPEFARMPEKGVVLIPVFCRAIFEGRAGEVSILRKDFNKQTAPRVVLPR